MKSLNLPTIWAIVEFMTLICDPCDLALVSHSEYELRMSVV